MKIILKVHRILYLLTWTAKIIHESILINETSDLNISKKHIKPTCFENISLTMIAKSRFNNLWPCTTTYRLN